MIFGFSYCICRGVLVIHRKPCCLRAGINCDIRKPPSFYCICCSQITAWKYRFIPFFKNQKAPHAAMYTWDRLICIMEVPILGRDIYIKTATRLVRSAAALTLPPEDRRMIAEHMGNFWNHSPFQWRSFWLLDCNITGVKFENYNRTFTRTTHIGISSYVNFTSPLNQYIKGLVNVIDFRHDWIIIQKYLNKLITFYEMYNHGRHRAFTASVAVR